MKDEIKAELNVMDKQDNIHKVHTHHSTADRSEHFGQFSAHYF